MAEPISFPSATPTFALPLLFAGQAQKEFFINQSSSMIDSLMMKCIDNSIASPPNEPVEGATYRIATSAQGDWSDHEDEVAIFVGGAWVYVPPFDGMTLFDRTLGAFLHYQSGWQAAEEPIEATGGSTVDVEARQMINELVEALRKVGIFSDSA